MEELILEVNSQEVSKAVSCSVLAKSIFFFNGFSGDLHYDTLIIGPCYNSSNGYLRFDVLIIGHC